MIRRVRAAAAGVATVAVLVVSACGAPDAEPAGASSAQSPIAGAGGSAQSSAPVPPARVGTPAASTRIRFIPESLTLPGGARTEVRPAETVDGELRVPERVRYVGWWDGGAYAGDPYGATVIAGHVDSASDGVGFFARLLSAKVGQRVSVAGRGHTARYRIVSVQSIAKSALATDSRAFDQTSDHRLVLITCTGAYDPRRGGYANNLVVIAEPIGLAR